MNSGTPDPADELSLILNIKQNNPSTAVDVVSGASRWLKSQLSGAGTEFDYTPCEIDNPSGVSVFSVLKETKGIKLLLDLKVAEVNSKPFVFAQIIQIGSNQGNLFPFFADLSTHEAKQNLLHYIADFLMA